MIYYVILSYMMCIFFLALCLSAGSCQNDFAGLKHDAKLQHNTVVANLAACLLIHIWSPPF